MKSTANLKKGILRDNMVNTIEEGNNMADFLIDGIQGPANAEISWRAIRGALSLMYQHYTVIRYSTTIIDRLKAHQATVGSDSPNYAFHTEILNKLIEHRVWRQSEMERLKEERKELKAGTGKKRSELDVLRREVARVKAENLALKGKDNRGP